MSSSPGPPTRPARRSAPAPGPTSCEEPHEAWRCDSRTAHDSRSLPDRPLRRRLRRLQPDSHRRGVRQAGRPAGPDPARAVDDGAGGARADRCGRRGGRAGIPGAPGRAVPRHGRAGGRAGGDRRGARGARRRRDRRHPRGAERQGDHPQRRGGSPVAYDPRVISPRQELILRKVVEAYNDSGQPVGSKTLAADPELEFGPSTIRNELAILEEQGLLAHPHTSAGRIPTDSGHRYYVDNLLSALPARTHGMDLQLVRREVDEAMRVTSETLSQVTNLLAIVSAPPLDTATI